MRVDNRKLQRATQRRLAGPDKLTSYQETMRRIYAQRDGFKVTIEGFDELARSTVEKRLRALGKNILWVRSRRENSRNGFLDCFAIAVETMGGRRHAVMIRSGIEICDRDRAIALGEMAAAKLLDWLNSPELPDAEKGETYGARSPQRGARSGPSRS